MSDQFEPLNRFLTDNNIAHFTAQELCKINRFSKPNKPFYNIPPENLWKNILTTLYFAEFIREFFGPIRIISGYRSRENNDRIPGTARRSKHILFKAIDCTPIKGDFKKFQGFSRSFWKSAEIFRSEEIVWLAEHNVDPLCMSLGEYQKNRYIHVDFQADRLRHNHWIG